MLNYSACFTCQYLDIFCEFFFYFSVSVEKQREIEEHQKIITSLTLQLKGKDKHNETLKQSLQSN